MRLDAQDYLRLVEKAGTIGFFDLESTGFRGDYNSILVASIKPFGKAPISFSVKQPGNDKRVAREAAEVLQSLDCWVTYYGKGFDVPMLNTRLLKWGLPGLDKRPHIDLYYVLKAHLNTSRRALGHLAGWLDVPEEKMYVSPNVWNRILYSYDEEMPDLIRRCESDVRLTEELYQRTKHLIQDIKR